MRISILSHLGQQASHLVCRFRAPGPRQPRRKPRPPERLHAPLTLRPSASFEGLGDLTGERLTSPRRHGHALPGRIPFDQPPHAGTHSDRTRLQGFSLHFLPSSTPERLDLQPLKPDSASPAHRLTISSLIEHHCRQQTHSSRPPHLSQKPFRQPIRVNHQYGPVSATNKHHLDRPPRTIKSDRGPPHRLNILITPTHPSRPR